MARAFPSSTFVGYDFHAPSIEHATAYARTNGAENVRFEVAKAKDFPARDLDLVTCFDVLHDLGDPVGAAAHIHGSLKPDGTWMLMEPLAGDATEDNLGPVGRVAYAFSTMACVPVSLSQEVGVALGAQAGQMKLTEVIKAGGFTQVRRAAETPLNMDPRGAVLSVQAFGKFEVIVNLKTARALGISIPTLILLRRSDHQWPHGRACQSPESRRAGTGRPQ
jgi:SAM-dependent methyltransferase